MLELEVGGESLLTLLVTGLYMLLGRRGGQFTTRWSRALRGPRGITNMTATVNAVLRLAVGYILDSRIQPAMCVIFADQFRANHNLFAWFSWLNRFIRRGSHSGSPCASFFDGTIHDQNHRFLVAMVSNGLSDLP